MVWHLVLLASTIHRIRIRYGIKRMPKRSKEDTIVTINTILDTAARQLLELGYDKMSYTTLSKETGISRTGISHHFSRKTDFTTALEGRFVKMVIDHLDCESSLEPFEKSWRIALNSEQFMSVFRLVFHHSIVCDDDRSFSQRFIDTIKKIVSHNLGDGAEKKVEWLIGITLIEMARAQ